MRDAAPHTDFIAYYAGPDIASNQRMRGKLQQQLYPACKTWLTVCNAELSQEDVVEQLAEKIESNLHNMDPDVLAASLRTAERLHGGHGNRGAMGLLVDFIKTQMRLRAEGPQWHVYVEAGCTRVITLLRERGYDPIPFNGAVVRKRRWVYPWWLYPSK